MIKVTLPHVSMGSLVFFVALLHASSESIASTFNVAQGRDLFSSDPILGVPIVSFDFNNTLGRNIGAKNPGNTDTIISRQDVDSPDLAGTFASSIDVFFDIGKGPPNGQTVLSSD